MINSLKTIIVVLAFSAASLFADGLDESKPDAVVIRVNPQTNLAEIIEVSNLSEDLKKLDLTKATDAQKQQLCEIADKGKKVGSPTLEDLGAKHDEFDGETSTDSCFYYGCGGGGYWGGCYRSYTPWYSCGSYYGHGRNYGYWGGYGGGYGGYGGGYGGCGSNYYWYY